MDLLKIVFSIVVVIHALFSFRVVMKYRKKIEENKDILEDNEQLQQELHNDSKKIIIMTIVNMLLLSLLNIMNLLPLLCSE